MTGGDWQAIPWTSHAPTSVVAFVDGEQVLVADCGGGGRRLEDSIADARLCAGSKQLIEAAKAARAVLSRQRWLSTSMDPEAVALRMLIAAVDRIENNPADLPLAVHSLAIEAMS